MQNKTVYTRRNSFQKPLPDMRKRAALVAWLVKHDRHADHNDPFLFSNCVKIHSLGLYGEALTKAYDVLAVMLESGDQWIYDRLFEAWESEQGGMSVGFAGRSSGHIALYGEPAANFSPDELAALELPELRRLTRLVHAFDGLCDDCVAAFLEVVATHEITTETINVREVVYVLRPIDQKNQE